MPAIMFPSSASLVHMLDCDPLKPNSGHLYLCQPHTIQIIQLVEATPPPRCISSVIYSSSAGSSSVSSFPSTSDSTSCSSYCSSIVTPDASSHNREPIPWTDDTYNTRMKRVHAWRDASVKATCALSGTPISPVPPSPSDAPPQARTPSLKRKTSPQQADDDTASHTSKRSRDGHGISRLTGHPCPACDTLFPSLSSLRKHGRTPNIPEACRVAVDYNFE